MWKYRTCLYHRLGKRTERCKGWSIRCRCCGEKWIVKSKAVEAIDRHCNKGHPGSEEYLKHDNWKAPAMDELGIYM